MAILVLPALPVFWYSLRVVIDLVRVLARTLAYTFMYSSRDSLINQSAKRIRSEETFSEKWLIELTEDESSVTSSMKSIKKTQFN